jgi:hypothetical protein
MPYTFSKVATHALGQADRCIQNLRNAPIRGRKTLFRLMTANMLAYTFADFVPGFSSSVVFNTKPYHELVTQPLTNADEEGRLFFDEDYVTEEDARKKVRGDIFETVSAAIMWNIAARWNTYMTSGAWPSRSPYPRPTAAQSADRQVGVLNLPRSYDWVKLLTADATSKIKYLRDELGKAGLSLPTSTPDLVVVVLPETHRRDALWQTELQNLNKQNQTKLQHAYEKLEGQIEPGEILLAVALKRSLRTDRLYQPLYEANIMQLLLEGYLDAPQVEFEVHTLEHFGTRALSIYEAASLFSVLVPERVKHRAVRELYVPDDAQELARRLLKFLNERTTWIV